MYSDGNSFEQILDRTLNNELLIDMDKREGSIVYNTLAPLCLELADAYVKLDVLEGQLSLLTATGENLDNRAYEQGIAREQATQAERTATFKKYKLDELALISQLGDRKREEPLYMKNTNKILFQKMNFWNWRQQYQRIWL